MGFSIDDLINSINKATNFTDAIKKFNDSLNKLDNEEDKEKVAKAFSLPIIPRTNRPIIKEPTSKPGKDGYGLEIFTPLTYFSQEEFAEMTGSSIEKFEFGVRPTMLEEYSKIKNDPSSVGFREISSNFEYSLSRSTFLNPDVLLIPRFGDEGHHFRLDEMAMLLVLKYYTVKNRELFCFRAMSNDIALYCCLGKEVY